MNISKLTILSTVCSTLAFAPLSAHNGFFIGAQAGGGIGSVPVTTTFQSGASTPGYDSARLGVRGGLIGAHAGLETQFLEHGVAGLQVSFDRSSIGASENRVFNIVGGAEVNPIKVRLNRAALLTAKLGYLVNNSVLFYLTIGTGYARWTFESTIDPDTVNKSRNLLGYMPGAGIAYNWNKSLRVGAEYSFQKYKSFKVSQPGTNLVVGPHKIKPNLHTITAKASWLI